jgi:uncharacterized protein (DUF3084 family)
VNEPHGTSGDERSSLLSIEIYGPQGAGIPAARPDPTEETPAASYVPTDDLSRREADVARRERALNGSEGLLSAGVADVERRERKLTRIEETLQERLRDVEEREVAIEQREIELEAAFGIREDRIEARESELAELEERLRRKEEDLARYVGQLQAQLTQPS